MHQDQGTHGGTCTIIGSETEKVMIIIVVKVPCHHIPPQAMLILINRYILMILLIFPHVVKSQR